MKFLFYIFNFFFFAPFVNYSSVLLEKKKKVDLFLKTWFIKQGQSE